MHLVNGFKVDNNILIQRIKEYEDIKDFIFFVFRRYSFSHAGEVIKLSVIDLL